MPFAVRWFYKPSKLDACIKIRVRGEGDGVAYNCGELPNVQIWLLATNFSPFEIEIDRIYGQLSYGCVIGDIIHVNRHIIPPAQEREILINVSLNENQRKFILDNQGKMETRLYCAAYIISKIHKIDISREINTNNIRHINCVR